MVITSFRPAVQSNHRASSGRVCYRTVGRWQAGYEQRMFGRRTDGRGRPLPGARLPFCRLSLLDSITARSRRIGLAKPSSHSSFSRDKVWISHITWHDARALRRCSPPHRRSCFPCLASFLSSTTRDRRRRRIRVVVATADRYQVNG
jgi:hypothetical protein